MSKSDRVKPAVSQPFIATSLLYPFVYPLPESRVSALQDAQPVGYEGITILTSWVARPKRDSTLLALRSRVAA
ncbi:hypothetical protein [Silvimonas sp.]|uniref:hypothetical protein n=1 Tax=Silvimonas sp. TaxID=2650811 RepID=UPI0028437F77|nr:hypothetical protein [Silvimonas sp.]MDR3429865.1 hypothetical protein [Silvimonas sp.]